MAAILIFSPPGGYKSRNKLQKRISQPRKPGKSGTTSAIWEIDDQISIFWKLLFSMAAILNYFRQIATKVQINHENGFLDPENLGKVVLHEGIDNPISIFGNFSFSMAAILKIAYKKVSLQIWEGHGA